MKNLSPFDRPLNIGEILDRTFRLYRHKLGPLFLTAAVLLIPIGILNVMVIGSTMLDSLGSLGGLGGLPTPSPAAANPFAGVLSILSGLATSIVTLALTHQGVELLHGKVPTLSENLGKGVRRFFGYLGMGCLQGLLLGGIIFAGAMLFFLVGAIAPGETFLFIVGGIVGSLFLVAAIYVGARWSASVPALIAEDLGPIEALSHSWELTKGYVWRAILFGILLNLLSVVVLIVPATLLGITAFVFTETPQIIVTFVSALEQLFNVMWLPLYAVAYVIFYFDLRVRRYGYDIAQRVEQFESETRLAASDSTY